MHTATNTVTSMTVPTIPRRTPRSGVSCTRTAVDEAGSGKRTDAGDVIAGVIVLNYFIGGELLKGKISLFNICSDCGRQGPNTMAPSYLRYRR